MWKKGEGMNDSTDLSSIFAEFPRQTVTFGANSPDRFLDFFFQLAFRCHEIFASIFLFHIIFFLCYFHHLHQSRPHFIPSRRKNCARLFFFRFVSLLRQRRWRRQYSYTYMFTTSFTIAIRREKRFLKKIATESTNDAKRDKNSRSYISVERKQQEGR